MFRKATFIAAAALALSACAKKPENIGALAVPDATYAHLDCYQLLAENQRVEASLATESAAQTSARSGDTIGVLLTGIPISSLSGSDRETQIAHLKGQRDALGRTRLAKRCG